MILLLALFLVACGKYEPRKPQKTDVCFTRTAPGGKFPVSICTSEIEADQSLAPEDD